MNVKVRDSRGVAGSSAERRGSVGTRRTSGPSTREPIRKATYAWPSTTASSWALPRLRTSLLGGASRST